MLQVDSAAAYRNEGPCAAAIRKSSILREDIFFTSKIPPRALSYQNTKAQVAKTLMETGLDYIDLMLIHAPYGGRDARKGAWKALVEAQEEGKIRSLGISNYGVHHLDEMEVYINELEEERGKGRGGVIDVGQWELHPVSDWLRLYFHLRMILTLRSVARSTRHHFVVREARYCRRGILPSCSWRET